ncbi:cupin domain-containing protein [Antarcticibacterium sp. 1MA-6-2]|uniref:cupin domain-containing protein n=1 Tax=Antarcticibacterium sp. 1MA-6-2 TaxID=2908210 RepID=UPI001F18C671|nr:cupin domain-containing protein [Antarcticibacterium sp. 1MA-6-2]UJH91401.1 cupin domain-containing protein [Antarcticibacterium sp. 1MA-6-2]
MEIIRHTKNSESEVLTVAGSEYRILVDGEQTGGNFAVIEMNIPPGSGPGLHSHKDIQETFYVAAGEVDFYSETGTTRALPGDFIDIPPGGAVHAFKNTSNEPAKLICTVMPTGLEEMFREVSKFGMEKAKEIGERYGNKFYPADYFNKLK